jgi:hypothetical protein
MWSLTACVVSGDDLDWYAEGQAFAENSLLDDGYRAPQVLRECRVEGEALTKSGVDQAEFLRGCSDYVASA